MATNLVNNISVGQLNACVVRAARLDADCGPTGGINGGIVTAALVTMSANPVVEDGTIFEPKSGCGNILFTFEQEDRIKRYTITGEFGFTDWELMALLFGGTLILGRAAGSYSGKVVGYADPLYNIAPRNGVYLEVITTAVTEGGNGCVNASLGASTPIAAVGHIFGKARLRAGDVTFANEVQKLMFSGTSTNNPNMTNGPWNDYPGAGYVANSAHVQVGYSQTEYDAIVATIGYGYKDIPAGS